MDVTIAGLVNEQYLCENAKSLKLENSNFRLLLTPRVGFEPTTNRLTADRSATELPRIGSVCYPHLLTIAELTGFGKAFDKLFFYQTASGFQQLMQPHSQLGEALLRFWIEGTGEKATGILFAGFVPALAAAGGGFYVSR